MNTLTSVGALIVTLALILYTLGFINERKNKYVTDRLLWLMGLGLFADVTATALMIYGSPNSPFTLHGFVGYSALLGMIIENIMLHNYRKKHSRNRISKTVHTVTLISYFWWIAAYITGSILAMA